MMNMEKDKSHEEIDEKWWFWGLMGEMCMVLLALTHGHQDFDSNIKDMMVLGSTIPKT